MEPIKELICPSVSLGSAIRVTSGAWVDLLFVLLLLSTGWARERGPRVDVVCPAPPTAVAVGKSNVLVYELHVTNFDTVPLTLERMELYADRSVALMTLAGEKLAAAMTRVGAAMAMSSGANAVAPDTRTIDPGGRNVIFLWVPLPLDQRVPMAVRHRLTFSVQSAGTTNPTETTLEDFQVAVSQEAVAKLSPPFRGGIWVAGDGPMRLTNFPTTFRKFCLRLRWTTSEEITSFLRLRRIAS